MVMPAYLGRSLTVSLQNLEGADVAKRRLVVLDTTADSAFALTTTSGDRSVLGVTLEAVVDGATGRVLVQGVTRCLVAGAVPRGNYLRASATPGALEDAGVLVDAAGDPPAGSCALALEAGSDGDELAVHFVGMLGGGSGGGGGGGPATQLDANGTILDVDAVTDGQYLRRVGATIVGGVPAGGGGGGWPVNEYNPAKPPDSPSAVNDEFDDLALTGWTQVDSGGGTRVISETVRRGFLYVSILSGGTGADTGVWKAFAPAGAPSTIVTRCFANVHEEPSNQAFLTLTDAAGTLIYAVGKLNGTSNFIVKDSSGFAPYQVTNAGGNLGETWLMIQYEGGTAYSAWVSADGYVFQRLTGASRPGTVGRVTLGCSAFNAKRTHAYFDFVRTFPSVTQEIGGVG